MTQEVIAFRRRRGHRPPSIEPVLGILRMKYSGDPGKVIAAIEALLEAVQSGKVEVARYRYRRHRKDHDETIGWLWGELTSSRELHPSSFGPDGKPIKGK